MTSADQSDEKTGTGGRGISDDQLPEDLQPSEDNPLAEPLDPADPDTPDPEELDVLGGRADEQHEDQDHDQGGHQDDDRGTEHDDGS